MTLLIIGVVIWSVIHFFPAVAVQLRSGLVQRIGVPAYKGIFGLLAIAALLLIIRGWKAAPVEAVYTVPSWGVYVTAGSMLIAFILFFAPYIRSSISRFLRHPQMEGVFLFGIGHLFANGEGRSLVLFGGLAAWALLEMLLLNRRDGPWKKPDPAAPIANLRLVLTGIGFFAIVMYLHGRLFGISVVPYFTG